MGIKKNIEGYDCEIIKHGEAGGASSVTLVHSSELISKYHQKLVAQDEGQNFMETVVAHGYVLGTYVQDMMKVGGVSQDTTVPYIYFPDGGWGVGNGAAAQRSDHTDGGAALFTAEPAPDIGYRNYRVPQEALALANACGAMVICEDDIHSARALTEMLKDIQQRGFVGKVYVTTSFLDMDSLQHGSPLSDFLAHSGMDVALVTGEMYSVDHSRGRRDAGSQIGGDIGEKHRNALKNTALQPEMTKYR